MFPYKNVALLNVAAAHRTASVALKIPFFSDWLGSYHHAWLTPEDASLNILALPVAPFEFPAIKLAKIDVQEFPVLRGMHPLIERDRALSNRSSNARDLRVWAAGG